MSQIELISASQVREIYSRLLGSAYERWQIYDPDYALISDIEAWEKINKDAKYAGFIEHRKRGIASGELIVQAKSDNDEDRIAAEILQELVDEVEDLHGAMFRLAEGVFRGDAWEYISGSWEGLNVGGHGSQTWWVPRNLHNMDRYRFRRQRSTEPEERKGPGLGIQWHWYSLLEKNWLPLENPEWFVRSVWNAEERSLGYGTSLLEKMFFFWRAKEVALSNGIDGLQRWAQGLLHIAIDPDRAGAHNGQTTAELATDWVTEMKKHMAEHVLVHDKNDEIEMIDGPTQGHQIVLDLVNYFDNAVSSLCLSSVLPTGGDSGTGSFARAQEEGEQMSMLFAFDQKTLAESLTRGLLRLTWKLNEDRIQALAPGARMGYFSFVNEQKMNPTEQATMIQGFMDRGVKFRAEDVYELAGMQMPAEGDITVGEAQNQMPIPGDGLGALFGASRPEANGADTPDLAARLRERLTNGSQ
jgi:hypothetical protein